jgi:hypothetical protein
MFCALIHYLKYPASVGWFLLASFEFYIEATAIPLLVLYCLSH